MDGLRYNGSERNRGAERDGGDVVRWYVIVALVCMVIAPFDALYMHIKANKRREALRRQEEEARLREEARTKGERP